MPPGCWKSPDTVFCVLEDRDRTEGAVLRSRLVSVEPLRKIVMGIGKRSSAGGMVPGQESYFRLKPAWMLCFSISVVKSTAKNTANYVNDLHRKNVRVRIPVEILRHRCGRLKGFGVRPDRSMSTGKTCDRWALSRQGSGDLGRRGIASVKNDDKALPTSAMLGAIETAQADAINCMPIPFVLTSCACPERRVIPRLYGFLPVAPPYRHPAFPC